MVYTTLGSTDIRISRIGFGCMSLPSDVKMSDNLINEAIDKGINFFDTADLYEKGENEKRVGSIIERKRTELVLATKVGNEWRADGSGWDWNPRKDYILKAVEESLKRLKTDYIDLYQLHGGTIGDPVDETIEAFEQLKKEGKIRAYGISSIRPNVIKEYRKRSAISSVMMQFSLLDRRPEEECMELLKDRGITIISRGSVAQGLLTGKAPKPYLNYRHEEISDAARKVKEVSLNERTPAQTALLYALQKGVDAAVVGLRSLEQLIEASSVASLQPLNADEITTLESSLDQNFYTEHR